MQRTTHPSHFTTPAPTPAAVGPAPPRSHDAGHTTLSASFSFAIPETWRPKGGIVRWINDLPGPKPREEPLQPSSLDLRSEKTMVRDEHRDKRARRFSAVSSKHTNNQPEQQQQQQQQQLGLLARGHRRAVESISSILTRSASHRKPQAQDQSPVTTEQHLRSETPASSRTAVHHHHHQQDDGSYGQQERYVKEDFSSRRASSTTMAGTTVRGSVISSSPPGTPHTVPGRPKMRFAFVGDPGCGKSSLLLRYYRDTFTEAYVPTQYELFTKTTLVDGQDVELELWDTSGDIALHQLQLLSYMTWDAVFLCFSVTSQKQFDRTQTQWLKEIRMNCRDAPVILVGCKKDLLRSTGSGAWDMLYQHNNSSSSSPSSGHAGPSARSSGLLTSRVAATEACLAAHTSGLIRYMECSAFTGAGVTDILHQGVRTVFDERAADEEALRMNMRCCGGGGAGRRAHLRRRLGMSVRDGDGEDRRRWSGGSRRTVASSGGGCGVYDGERLGMGKGGMGDRGDGGQPGGGLGTGIGRFFCFA